jgi:hypothetical protein
VDCVHSYNSHIPIIIESPLTRSTLGNQSGKGFGPLVQGRPVYRISSGIDERVQHITELTKAILARGYTAILLLEDTPYSVQIKDEVLVALEHESAETKKLTVYRIPKKDPVEKAAQAFQADFVFYLGTGARYHELANAHLAGDQRVVFAGLMNAWAFPGIHPSAFPKLVDLEDFTAHQLGVPESTEQHRFKCKFGDITPQVRDQAFSYDAGICVRNAWRDALANRQPGDYDYNSCLRLMQSALERSDGHDGITGYIHFPSGGGQNTGLSRHYVLHASNPAGDKIIWSPIMLEDILKKMKPR